MASSESANRKKRGWPSSWSHKKKRHSNGAGKRDGGGSSISFSSPSTGHAFTCLQYLRQGGQAILMTCEVGREHKASKELRAILERYAEEEKGEESKESEKQEEDEHMEEPASGGGERGTGHSVRDSLRQEIAELQASETKGPKSRMLPVDTGCNGSSGVSIPQEKALNPVKLCIRMLEEAGAGHSSSRYIIKLMPLEKICYGGTLNLLKEQVKELLVERKYFSGDVPEKSATPPSGPRISENDDGKGIPGKKPTYMISLSRRSYASHTREEIYDAIGEVIQDRWEVDLKNPEHVLVVEAIKGTIGVSLCDRFMELKKYNLRQIQNAAREQQQAVPSSS